MKKIALLLFFSLQLSAQKKQLTQQQLHQDILYKCGNLFGSSFNFVKSRVKKYIDSSYVQIDKYGDIKMITIRYDNKNLPDAFYNFRNDTCSSFSFLALGADLPHFQAEMDEKKCKYYVEDKFYYSDALKLYYTYTPMSKNAPTTTEVICTSKRPDYFGIPIPIAPPITSSAKNVESQAKTTDQKVKNNAIAKNIPKSKIYNYYIALGQKKFDEKDYLGSVIDNTKAIEVDPLNDSAYINRAVAKVFLKDSINSAIVDLSRALALNTSRAAHVYQVRGMLKGNLDDYTGAQLDFSLALGEENITDKLKIDCYVGRARVSAALKNYHQAVADYSSAIELDPTNANYYNARGATKALSEDLNGACVDWYMAKDLGSTDAAKFFKDFCK